MNRMAVSPWLMVSNEGPITCAEERGGRVHMRQGDADGACGPYALMMGLITLGVLDRDHITDMSAWHGNSREGRFRNALLEHGALISRGTNILDLIGLADHFSGLGIQAEQTLGNKKTLIDQIQRDIENDAIPLISVSWSRFEGHWLMVVGHQGYEAAGVYQPTHLLCLDPLSEAPKASLWNAVIEVVDEEGNALRGGTFTCDHWGLDGNVTQCKLDELLTLSRS
ncbi:MULTISPECIES: hypothetical protein [Pseudomonas aeruginosa group]|uniref:hypothetical protein n=1 Tax=Pseudomonas aeruginosa group TaxID=136841 RepID=UPI0003C367E8|nr:MULTISPECIES: hypothetical protein [Pseudomonas aeruginosa group]ESR68004.1 hypothetical protein T266_27410 [Pseudomonas aeruginosa VRFPA05]QFZ64104.1 hypothetical protein FVF66_28515 [Pseudomonas aeruginosa PA99]ALV79037.1 hypothetical protein AOY09_03993 [Pseudomonas aeruginosa]EIU1415701.1 hypothetical protein [Pseudomonas aeruginosa]EIU4874220.1 hypothetical protein [Pseudomonas aeruginosa]